MMRRVLLTALLLCGCSDDSEDQAPWEVTVTAEDFDDLTIDNRFHPLPVGARWVYEAETADGLEVIVVEVLEETREVWDVTTTVVRDTVSLDGELVEDTSDWFAQDAEGNVWYFGEDTCEYEDDVCVDTSGAWEAGVEGALPGIQMLADPEVGTGYYQEFAEGEAEDQGEVVATDVAVDVPAGSWTGCVKTRDFTALQPDVVAFKYYCEDVGLVLEEEDGTRVELVSFSGL